MITLEAKLSGGVVESVSYASPAKLNTTPHLNRAKVKKTILEQAKQLRPANGFSRVGVSFIERIEAATRAAIVSEIKRHPSKGKTLL